MMCTKQVQKKLGIHPACVSDVGVVDGGSLTLTNWIRSHAFAVVVMVDLNKEHEVRWLN